LIQAFADLLKSDLDVVLRIVGDGECRSSLEALAARLGICDRIDFRGERQDVRSELAGMDVFVLPSLWEGLPLALLEAMATALPVICSDVDGIPEVVTDGENGILIPPSSPDALSAALRTLYADPDLRARYGSAAEQTVREHYSLERMMQQLETVYNGLVG
jgi:glycosyltransferase involved in cell wall biosynthesis